MDINKFDDLNNLLTGAKENRRSMEYEQYFGEMELTDEEKQERIDLANELDDMFFFILLLILTYREYGQEVVKEKLVERLADDYSSIVVQKMDIDGYLDEYIKKVSDDIISTTLKYTDEYYTSLDRAMFIAENEANALYNYQYFRKAVLSGKKLKEWVAIQDKTTRKWHSMEDGTVVPITSYFTVKGDKLLFPKDTSMNPKASNLVNCRCVAKYF